MRSWEFELVAGPLGSTTEGTVWDGQALLFTHIPKSRIMRYDPSTGECTEYRTDTERTNGLALDRQGRLFGCTGGASRITLFHEDGSTTPLPNTLDGKRINRPNDLAIDRKGRIWFSDPFGRHYSAEDRELDFEAVLRLDPTPDGSYELKRMTYDTVSPNGVLFSKDERTLYVAVGGYKAPVRELRAYPLQDDDTLGAYKVLHTFGRDQVSEWEIADTKEKRPDFIEGWGVEALGTHRGIDGMTLDTDGNIIGAAGWREWGAGSMIYVISPEGRVLETHPVPVNMPTNCTFGDPDLSSLYVGTTGGHLWRVRNTGRRGYLTHLR